MSQKQAGDYITKEKRKALEEELADLRGPKRKEILDALQYAKSLGDLSENAEYHQAREDQGKLESRIAKVEQILQSSETVAHGGGDKVEVGSNVVVQKVPTEGRGSTTAEAVGKNISYTIVGSEEANMAEGKISNRSPLGMALYGKTKGDDVVLQTPRGSVNYKIISVS
jgi:transcription elongation factor GreA